MYQSIELAEFAIAEFRRGLEGLTPDEARTRVPKAGAGEMNAITWIAGHVSTHWLSVAALAAGHARPEDAGRFAGANADPTPPELETMLARLDAARSATREWLAAAADELLAQPMGGRAGGENLGEGVLRATLHTWFHAGEVNAVRQMLGHAEIPFVGPGVPAWRPAGGS